MYRESIKDVWSRKEEFGLEIAMTGEYFSGLGSNVPTIGGLPTGFRLADEWGCESIQVYLTLSRRWDVPELTKEEIGKFKTAWEESSVKEVVAHIPFLVNLASPDKEIRRKSIERLKIEISRANEFGVKYPVLHPGSYGNTSKKVGIDRIVEGLNTIPSKIDNPSIKILLETMAGQGTAMGSTFEELATIFEKLENPEFFGVCFDVAHVFMAGYDIRGYRGYERVMQKFDKVVGLDKIKVIHLNDSKTKLNSHNDRHANIGEGELGLQVFHAILRDRKFRVIPKILEIPDRDKRTKDDLNLLRRLQTASEAPRGSRPILSQLTFEEIAYNVSRHYP